MEFSKLVVDDDQFVALKLKKMPEAKLQPDNRKNLLIELQDDQTLRLKEFTTRNVMKQVALVIDGQAVTVHKIREPITGGQIQISRCTDNACEKLYYELQHDVKN
jgi:preprotein translocase subunit SecD